MLMVVLSAQASDMRQQLELASELESDQQTLCGLGQEVAF